MPEENIMASLADVLASSMARSATIVNDPDIVRAREFSSVIPKWVSKWAGGAIDNSVLRCSGLYSLCPRQFVINYWRPSDSGKVFGSDGYLRMSTGTALHKILQNVILGSTHILEGTWKNIGTGELVVGTHPDPLGAVEMWEKYQEYVWDYVEPTYWDEHYRLSGHGDGVLSLDKLDVFMKLLPKLGARELIRELASVTTTNRSLLEIKSTSTIGFAKIAGPSLLPGYYSTQATLYQRLSGIHSTIFLYLSRDTCALKSFEFKGTDEMYGFALSKAAYIWEAIRDRKLPTFHMQCMSSTDLNAKECPHSKTCFEYYKGGENVGNFEEFVLKAIEDQPDRKFPDLSGWKRCSLATL